MLKLSKCRRSGGLLQNWTYERILNESPLGCFNDRIKKLRSSSS